MKSIKLYNYNYRTHLLLLSAIAILFLFVTNNSFISKTINRNSETMQKSVLLTKKWFNIVIDEKNKRGIHSDSKSNVPYSEMMGADFSSITTTLGSIEAKELSTNPEFAAVITNMLMEEGIDSNSVVGIMISGSFPSLAIAALASLQTIGANVYLNNSLGASSYGANQPEATWIDMENWLRKKGGLEYKTSILTIGAENDNGTGLMDEGIELIKKAAERNSVQLFIPNSLEESIVTKTNIFTNAEIDLFINIGGNQSAMGECPHSLNIPNGMNKPHRLCYDDRRGVLSRLSEIGIPFLHLLNIKDLAIKNNISIDPGISYGNSGGVYLTQNVNKIPVLIFLGILVMGLLVLKKRNFNETQN